MADRYWVGGGGPWDTTSTTNWSATSGGASGATAPTAIDNVIFDANSGSSGTVSMFNAVCLSFNSTNVLSGLKFTGTFDCNGSAFLGANMSAPTSNQRFSVTFVGAGTGRFFSSSISDVYPSQHLFNVVVGAGSVSVLSDIYCNRVEASLGATLSFNSIDVSCRGFTVLGTVNLNASTINIHPSVGPILFNSPEFTIGVSGVMNAGTSTINYGYISGVQSTQRLFELRAAGAVNFYNLNIFFNGYMQFPFGTNAPTASIAVSNNFSVNGGDSPYCIFNLVTTNYIAVTGNFVLSGFSPSRRIWIKSFNTTSKLINLTGSISRNITNCDFAYITLTYSSSVSGTNVGNRGFNSNITFTPSRTLYLVNSVLSENYSSSTIWSLSSGGATGQNPPLPQDTVYFDINSGVPFVNVDVSCLGGNLNSTFSPSFSVSPEVDFVFYYGTANVDLFFWGDIQDVVIASLSNTTFPPSFGQNFYINCPSLVVVSVNQNIDMTTGPLGTGKVATLGGTLNLTSNTLSCIFLEDSATEFSETNGKINYSSTLNLSSGTLEVRDYFYIQTTSLTAPATSKIRFSPTGTPCLINFFTQTANIIELNPSSHLASFEFGSGFSCSVLSKVANYFMNVVLSSGTTNTIGTLNISGQKGSGTLVKSSGNAETQSTIAITSNQTTDYVAYYGIQKSGASTLNARGVANIYGNSNITFSATNIGYSYVGSSGNALTVPNDFGGSSLFIVVGGGGSAAKKTTNGTSAGGGGGAISVVSNINITPGQSVYVKPAPPIAQKFTTGDGTAGGTSYFNTTGSISIPSSWETGTYALGGGASFQFTNNGGTGGAATPSIGTHISFPGGNGGSANASGGGGGGGGSAGGVIRANGKLGGNGSSGGGGGGGAGINTNGISPAFTTGGNGGSNQSGIGGGIGGALGANGGNATAASAGGGGGGATNVNGGFAGSGGAGLAGIEFAFSFQNNGAFSSTIGSGGGSAGSGGSDSAGRLSTTSQSSGTAPYGGGGGGVGRGVTVGNPGGTQGGFVMFIYEVAKPGGNNFGTIIG